MNALIRWPNPAATLTDLFDDLLNESFFSRRDRELAVTAWPRVDIVEGADSYTIHADLPGLNKEDIKIAVERGTLSITGEKKETVREEKKDRYFHLERRYGSFRRSFNLPDTVDADHITANYKNGVLELFLKKTKKAEQKEIEVKIE